MWKPPFFQIFYSTTFTVLLLLLTALLLITPADSIRQALETKKIYLVSIVAGVCLVTFILAILLYASRLFSHRSALASIPRAWIPIEKGEVTRSVRKMIAKGLARSALITWHATPKDFNLYLASCEQGALSVKDSSRPSTAGASGKQNKKTWHRQNPGDAVIPITPPPPPWGHIAHPGWSSPSTPDFPNTQYGTVISELPHLIEAKAVSLAPPDPPSQPLQSIELETQQLSDSAVNAAASTYVASPEAVAILSRPTTMGLRDYLSYLTTLDLIEPPELGESFLTQYENARFSTREVPEEEFRALMRAFAEILRGMVTLSDSALELIREAQEIRRDDLSFLSSNSSGPSQPEHDTSSGHSTISDTHSFSRSRVIESDEDEDGSSTVHTAPSRLTPSHRTTSVRDALSGINTPWRTAPGTPPRQHHNTISHSQHDLHESFHPPQRPVPRTPSASSFRLQGGGAAGRSLHYQSSHASLASRGATSGRSFRSGSLSSAGGSVIRLAQPGGMHADLPYTILTAGGRA